MIPTEKNTEHGPYLYAYDDIDRLVEAEYPTFSTEHWTYDPLGNRMTDARTGGAEWEYNDNNELLDSVEYAHEYDDNGSLIAEYHPDGSLYRTFDYNAETRLSAVRDHNQELIAEYLYEPFGRRVSKTVYDPPGQNPETTWYVYSDLGLMAELNNEGNQQDFYLFPPYGLWSTDPILRRSGASYFYYQTDHLGTPQQMIDGAGNVVHSREMRAFGEVAQSGIEDRWRLPGQLESGETGLYYNYFRDYQPGTGRYVQSDPIGLGGGYNIYVYAENNGLSFMDPNGLNAWNDFLKENPGDPREMRNPYRQRQLDDMVRSPRPSNRGHAAERLGDLLCYLMSLGVRRNLDDVYWQLHDIERQLDHCERLCYVIWFEVSQFVQRECLTDVLFHVGHCPPSSGLHTGLNNSVRYIEVETGELRNEENVCCAF